MCTITPVCDIHSRHILCALGLFIFLKHLKTANTKIPNIHLYPTTTIFIHIQANHNRRSGMKFPHLGEQTSLRLFDVFIAVIMKT